MEGGVVCMHVHAYACIYACVCACIHACTYAGTRARIPKRGANRGENRRRAAGDRQRIATPNRETSGFAAIPDRGSESRARIAAIRIAGPPGGTSTGPLGGTSAGLLGGTSAGPGPPMNRGPNRRGVPMNRQGIASRVVAYGRRIAAEAQIASRTPVRKLCRGPNRRDSESRAPARESRDSDSPRFAIQESLAIAELREGHNIALMWMTPTKNLS